MEVLYSLCMDKTVLILLNLNIFKLLSFWKKTNKRLKRNTSTDKPENYVKERKVPIRILLKV